MLDGSGVVTDPHVFIDVIRNTPTSHSQVTSWYQVQLLRGSEIMKHCSMTGKYVEISLPTNISLDNI